MNAVMDNRTFTISLLTLGLISLIGSYFINFLGLSLIIKRII